MARQIITSNPGAGQKDFWGGKNIGGRKIAGRKMGGRKMRRRRIGALLKRVGESNRARSATVPGRIKPRTDLAPVSITQIRWPIVHR
ncbi:MAG: hypothetical protein ACP5MD_04445, partial [Verrucomicrobiia bacterium]